MTAPGDVEILLVEDNPGDVELIERLRAGEMSNHLPVAGYGADALAHLRSVPGDAASHSQRSCWTSTCPTRAAWTS